MPERIIRIIRVDAVDRVLVDMDGVLADLHAGVVDVLGIPDPYDDPELVGVWDWWGALGYKKPDFWRLIGTVDFWAGLPPMPQAFDLIEVLCQQFGAENLAVCTHPPSETPAADHGKRVWLERHIPWLVPRLIKTAAKEMAAGPDALLLDDGEHNVRAFRMRRGQALLMPTRGNANHRFADDPVQFLCERLR